MKFTERAIFCSLALTCLAVNSFASTPVFRYSWPASGLTPEIVDLSSAGNNASPGNAVLDPAIPPGAPAGTESLNTTDGGAATLATDLLENAAVAAAGGFRYDVQFLWDGTNDAGSTVLIQKIIDYAGTESLQLEALDLAGGTGTLRFLFNDNNEGPTTTINANQWYTVSAVFQTTGGVQGDGSVPGIATLTVDGSDFTQAVSKTDFGDSLDRAIGVGGLSLVPNIIELHGLIYDPSVKLLPEPGTFMLSLAGLGGMVAVRRRRR